MEIEAQYFRFKEITGKDPDYFECHAVISQNFFIALRNVAKKYGLFYENVVFDQEFEKENNIYEVYNLEYKISDDTGSMCKYNASNDKLDCGSYNNRCYTKKTNYGVAEYINISCDDDYTTE